MTLVKICGLMRVQDAEAVNAAGADFAGFILSKGFRRSIDATRAAEISSHLSQEVRPVGVFVDEPVEFVAELIESGTVEVAQLHGSESDDYIDCLRARMPECLIVKAFRVRNEADIAQANASHADLVLLDNGQGTGEAFDWSHLESVKRPYVLAGGLGAHNVAQAVRQFSPYAVDMSSGVETDGLKDSEKIAKAVRAVRACTQDS